MRRFTARQHIAAVLSTILISLALHGLISFLPEMNAHRTTVSHVSDVLVLPSALR